MSRYLILAIDGGQTSTKAIIAHRDGTILGWGRGTPCDHILGQQGRERNRVAIHSATAEALAHAGRSVEDIIAVGMGLTSAARENRATPIFEDIVRGVCSPNVIWVDADIVSNLYGASAGEPGVVVIAGGGSISYGVDADGNEAVAGGLGYLMGDDGSAWDIGLRAIQAATRANDTRGDETALLPFVMDHFELGSMREIVRVLYGPDFTRDKVSAIAPDVVRIAEHDAVAHQIVTSAGEKLAQITLATIHQLHQPEFAVDVYPTGGVFAAGPLITEPFQQELRQGWPTAVIKKSRFAPVVGGLIQAVRCLGDDISPAFLDRVEQSSSIARQAARASGSVRNSES